MYRPELKSLNKRNHLFKLGITMVLKYFELNKPYNLITLNVIINISNEKSNKKK